MGGGSARGSCGPYEANAPNHFGADGASGGVDEQEDEFPVGCRQH